MDARPPARLSISRCRLKSSSYVTNEGTMRKQPVAIQARGRTKL